MLQRDAIRHSRRRCMRRPTIRSTSVIKSWSLSTIRTSAPAWVNSDAAVCRMPWHGIIRYHTCFELMILYLRCGGINQVSGGMRTIATCYCAARPISEQGIQFWQRPRLSKSFGQVIQVFAKVTDVSLFPTFTEKVHHVPMEVRNRVGADSVKVKNLVDMTMIRHDTADVL